MARLIYSAITSLDGHVADGDGNFDWAAPDEELHTFVNDLERSSTSRLASRTSRRSGRRPTRSCTPQRCRRHPAARTA